MFDAAALRVKQKQSDLSAFLKENGLSASVYRTQVVGYNRDVNRAVGESIDRQGRERQAQELERQIIAEIKAAGIKGHINLHPVIPDVKSLGFDDTHINIERRHNVTREQAEAYIINAKVSISRRSAGRAFENFYSYDGASYVDIEEAVIRTAFASTQFDERTRAMMEVLKKYGIK